jgi:uncharacterized protein
MAADLLSTYAELCAKVDAFFVAVHARQRAQMACRPGCDACCQVQLSVTTVEAAAVARAVAALPAPARARLRARASAPDAGRCAALEEDGRCAVYAARPLVCRSHGLPVRMGTRRGLPLVQSCELNFVTGGPASAPAADILDQEKLSVILHSVDATYRAAAGKGGPQRRELATVLRGEQP